MSDTSVSLIEAFAKCAVKRYCSALQRIPESASKSDTLQHTAAYCNALQHTATYCNALQHTATHCNALQHIPESASTSDTLVLRMRSKALRNLSFVRRACPICMCCSAFQCVAACAVRFSVLPRLPYLWQWHVERKSSGNPAGVESVKNTGSTPAGKQRISTPAHVLVPQIGKYMSSESMVQIKETDMYGVETQVTRSFLGWLIHVGVNGTNQREGYIWGRNPGNKKLLGWTHSCWRHDTKVKHRVSVLQCVAVCCSVLQRVAVCCSVFQGVAVCISVLQCVQSTVQSELLLPRLPNLLCVAVCCSVSQSVAVCYSCDAVCCCVLQHVAVCAKRRAV